MSRSASAPAPDLRAGLQQTFVVTERLNQMLLEQLNPRAWRAQLSGSKVRTIAAIFSHVHNIRGKWIRLSAPHLKLPPKLDRASCTQQQASHALSESAALCSQMLAEALAGHGRVRKFHRDGWAPPWAPGAGGDLRASVVGHGGSPASSARRAWHHCASLSNAAALILGGSSPLIQGVVSAVV